MRKRGERRSKTEGDMRERSVWISMTLPWMTEKSNFVKKFVSVRVPTVFRFQAAYRCRFIFKTVYSLN